MTNGHIPNCRTYQCVHMTCNDAVHVCVDLFSLIAIIWICQFIDHQLNDMEELLSLFADFILDFLAVALFIHIFSSPFLS